MIQDWTPVEAPDFGQYCATFCAKDDPDLHPVDMAQVRSRTHMLIALSDGFSNYKSEGNIPKEGN